MASRERVDAPVLTIASAPTGRSVLVTCKPVWSAVEAAGVPELPIGVAVQQGERCLTRHQIGDDVAQIDGAACDGTPDQRSARLGRSSSS